MKKKSFKSVISIILAIIMLVQVLPVSAIYAAATNLTPIDLGTVSVSDVYILTNNQFVSTSDIQTGTGNGYQLSESTPSTAKNVYVGDNTYSGNAYTANSNIGIDIAGTDKTLALLDILPVNKGNYTVNATVSKDSKIATLKLEKNAKLTLNLESALTVENVQLENGSELTVNANRESFKITGDTTGTGSVTVSGDNISVNNMTVGSFVANKATVDANGKNITATNTLSVTSSTISNAAFLGYGDNAKGNKTLTFAGNGNVISNVNALGVMPNGLATVFAEGTNTISNSSNTNYYFDYAVNYKYNNQTLSREDDWVASYRVKYAGTVSSSTASIIGYHEENGAYNTSADITLPEYTVEGYNYLGWTLDGSDKTITTVPSNSTSALDLTVSLEVGTVLLTCDLGFTPSADTNDDYKNMQKVYDYTAQWNSDLTLQRPVRFGYVFDGWKVTTGKAHGTYNDTYKVSLSDADKNGSSYTLNLEAQWSAKSFPLRFLITTANVNQMKVKVGSKTYDSITDFANKNSNVTWDATGQLLQFDNINYGESIDAYFTRMGYSDVPELIDTRTGAEKVDFAGWTTPGGALVSPEMTFSVGSLLDNRSSSETLKQYETQITTTPSVLTSSWGTAKYKFTVDIANGWDILVDGQVQSPSSLDKVAGKMTVSVPVGSTIAFRSLVSANANFSLWNFTDGFLPTEGKYSASLQYLTYTATMPNRNVTATFGNVAKMYIDLSQSSITMQQNVTLPSGRTVDGFWYGKKMVQSEYDGMTVNAMAPAFQQSADASEHAGEYFYVWKYTDAIRVTTCDNATTNQLTLVNAITLYLKDCNMTATNDYKSLSGTTFEGVDLEDLYDGYYGKNISNRLKNANADYSKYANILIDTSLTKIYNITAYVQGDNNTIACISTNSFNYSADYMGLFAIRSENSTKRNLNLGTFMGDFKITMQYLNINEYNAKADNNFVYLFYTAYSGYINVINSVVNAKSKIIYSYSTSGIYFANSQLYVYGVRGSYYLYLVGTSYAHVYSDVLIQRAPLYLMNSSSIVVEGNVLSLQMDRWSTSTINTTGFAVIKGSIFSTSSTTITNGTIICNVFAIGSYFTSSNGAKIVTNLVTNTPYNYVSYNSSNLRYYPTNSAPYKYVITSCTSIANQNKAYEDSYPFISYVANANVLQTYSFGAKNGALYLLGYYSVATNNKLDTTINATDENNPIKPYIDKCINSDGDLVSSPSIDESALKDYVNTSNSKKECIVLGSTAYPVTNQTARTVVFSGTNVYAAGNITLFNDTTVSGGSINCSGDFGSKLDLKITDGTVNAKTVGNVQNFSLTGDDSTKTWNKTTITGGAVNAETIGARDSYGTLGTAQRSLVEITGGTVADNTKVRSDEYINYIYNTSDFPTNVNSFSSMPNNIRFDNTYTSSSFGTWSTVGIDSFTAPKLANNSVGSWLFDSLSGQTVTSIATDGAVVPKADPVVYAYGKDNLKLYAVKNSYTLTQVYGTQYYDIKVGTTTPSFSNTTMTDIADLSTIDVKSLNTPINTDITLSLSSQHPELKTRVVAWYIDGNGLYHNALADSTWNDLQVTFKMPKGNCYIYVVDDSHVLPLDLWASGFTFTGDGFITEFTDTRDSNGDFVVSGKDRVFTYSGDYKIVQSNLKLTDFTDPASNMGLTLNGGSAKYTHNRLYFAKEFNNISSANNEITISRVFQQCNDTLYGTVLENDSTNKSGANVKLQVDGKISMFRFNIFEFNTFEISGIHGSDEDLLYMNKAPSSNYDCQVVFGNHTGKAGSMTVENLKLNGINGYMGYIFNSGVAYSGTVLMKNCLFNRNVWSDGVSFFRYINDITLDNCQFNIVNNITYTSQFFSTVRNISLTNNTTFNWLNVGSYRSGTMPFEYGVSGQIIIDNSTFNTSYEPNSIDNDKYFVCDYYSALAPKVIIQNNGSYNAENRYLFRALEVNTGGQLNLKTAGNCEETYLFSQDISVDGGTINCDNLIVSGYYTNINNSGTGHAETKESLDARISSNTNVINGSNYKGLVVKSGTVNAKKFVGGSYNAKITVTGGEINSPAIGTNGKLYGYITVLPKNLKDYVYSYDILDYSNYTQNATVTVNGGTINVTDGGYVGGMNANVYTNGGTVKLSDGAVVGITDSQIKTLTDYYLSKGDDISNHKSDNIKVTIAGGTVEGGANSNIYAPYGNIVISGENTKVKADNILADYGSVTIQGAKSAFSNPYTGKEESKYKSSTVGVYVNNTLSAQDVTINAGAQVFAKNAYAVVDSNGNGRLTVSQAGLYSEAYGEKGINRNSADKTYNDTPNAKDQTVFGTHMVTVTYDLNPQGDMFDYDVAEVKNDNVLNYTVTGTATTINMTDAACAGYYFRGWYNNAAFEGDAVTSLNTTIANDLTLYAKWEKISVSFVVFIDKNSTDYYEEAEFDNNSGWVAGDGGYYSTKVVNIKYGDKILTTDGVNLIDYTTNTLGVTELAIKEDDYANSGTINASSIVTKELAEFYKNNKLASNSNIKLYVNRVQKRYALITFLLNKKDGKPTDAAYANDANQLQANIGVSKPLSTLDTIVDSTATGNSKGIIQAKATGYTFVGWNTDKDADIKTTTGWINDDSTFTANTTAYAIWQANTYLIEFNAGEGSWVTKDNTTPAVGSPEVKKLNYYWIYDTPISNDTSFWLKDEQTHKYMDKLPYAWKEGSKFDEASGWHYSIFEGDELDGKLVEGTISNTTELTHLAIKALNTAVGDPNENPTQVALLLTAEYTPVQVTYNLDGGKWSGDSSLVQHPEYNEALEGYTANTVDSNANVTAEATGENGNTYYVADTKATYFADNSKYVADDYRNELGKKGYTFYGWYTSKENADSLSGNTVGTTPRFNDITLYAGWKANSYTVNVNNNDSNKTYNYTSFNDVASAKGINVTVGQEINDNNWPGRSGNWYAYNKSDSSSSIGENAKRYFLGATFAALDPGSTVKDTDGYDVYIKYAQAVTSMINDSTLYQNHSGQTDGSVFFLPEDNVYSNDINVSYDSNYSVADYPQGSTIEMYAVYRERSLVFVERYIDPLGNVQQNVKYSDAWNTWSNYPQKYGTNGNTDITRQGYSLIGWYVNGITTSSTPYPSSSADYDKQKDNFKKAAEDIGTYDIMVYTVYAAQVNRDVVLQSKSDPTDNNLPSDAYLMPSSMQNGVLSVLLDELDSNLNIVSKTELESHKYDLSWTSGSKTYNSDNTVALIVTASKDNDSKTMDCGADLSDDSLLKFEKEVEAGWQIMFTLYHSKVITTSNEYKFDLTAKFDKSNGDNTLKDQFIKNHIIIKLQPSIYTVNYTITLPEAQSKLTVNDWGYFTASDDSNATVITKQESMAYNSALTDKKPQIEGYSTVSTWKYDKDNSAYNKLNMSVSEANNGIINVSTSYTALTYKLFADVDTLTNWNITYTDGALSNVQTSLSGSQVNVKYHSAIKFTPKTSGVAASPEFITLTLSDGSNQTKIKLPEYASLETGVYGFIMPAMDISASYVTVETLYLDDGTISITPTGYTHYKAEGTVVRTWPGDYIILQNATNDSSKATANVLNLSGDLSDRTIDLGNISISSNNSVYLDDTVSTKADLTLKYKNNASSLNIKNINVSNDSLLNLSTGLETNTNAPVTISPDRNYAAIGSNDVSKPNGQINVNNISLSVYMPAGSSASGIGASSSSSTAGEAINLTDCVLNLSEGSDTQVYSGSWIGGNNVSSVKLTNVTVNRLSDKHMAGPKVIDADNVTLNKTNIGSSDYPVFDPIYAKSSITVNDSQIYQNIQDNIASSKANAPLSTANGKINVNNSVVNAIRTGTISAIADLYTGTLYINDANSEVYIDGTQIVEVANGNISVDSSAYTQNSVSHNTPSNRNYLLLEELSRPSADPDLTVNAFGNDNKITVKYPNKGDEIYASSNGIYLGKLTLNTNTNIELNSNLFVSSKATIKSGNTLTVNADTAHNPAVNFTSNETVFADSTGVSYIQNGGKFNSVSDLGNGNVNVTLSDVDASVKNLIANNLTVTDNSNVKASGSQVGSKPVSTSDASNVTDVVIKDSTVSATTIGALGEYDKTFTNVTLTNADAQGTVVKDNYRLTYDKSNSNVNTDGLAKILRSSQVYSDGAVQSTTYLPAKGIPANPSDDDNFYSWYINWCNNADTQEYTRKALSDGQIPAGLDDKTTLVGSTVNNVISKDSISNSDGTKTLVVHAWVKATGNVNVEKGRNFVVTKDYTLDTITVQNNASWTAKITSTGTFIDNRDYRVTFGDNLPVNTKLTLTVPTKSGVNDFYYYTVSDNNTKAVKFSDFSKMGTDDKFDTTSLNEFSGDESEAFLLSVDFKYTSGATANNENVSVDLIPREGSTDVFNLGNVSFSLSNASKGVITANSDSVTISSLPNDSENLSGKKIYLKATLTDASGNEITAKYDVKAAYGDIMGKWTSKNEVRFELGDYDSISNKTFNNKYSFENLENGSYTVNWSLIACDSNETNKIDGLISNEATVSYVINVADNSPYMKVTTNTDNRVITQGNAKTVTFNYVTDSNNVKVFAEKQSTLCNFNDMGNNSQITYTVTKGAKNSDGMNTGSVTVNFASTLEEGSYRIRFSMNDSTNADDCYFTYVVKSAD